MVAIVAAMWIVRAWWRAAERAAGVARFARALTRRPPRSDIPRPPLVPERSAAHWSARHPRRTASKTEGRTVDEYCCCGHVGSDHVDGAKRCRGEDDEGERCNCDAFETGTEQDED